MFPSCSGIFGRHGGCDWVPSLANGRSGLCARKAIEPNRFADVDAANSGNEGLSGIAALPGGELSAGWDPLGCLAAGDRPACWKTIGSSR